MSSSQLKAEGNTLYVAKKFKEASKKYTEAIQASDEAVDPKGLAVLYANRAACSLALKSSIEWLVYMDACDDANKATKLDPGYAKAWARLASANEASTSPTSRTSQSQVFWKRALDALPKSDLSESEKAQKSQYKAAYEAAVAAAERIKKNPPTLGVNDHAVQMEAGRMPWEIATAMLPILQGETVPNPLMVGSSVRLELVFFVVHQLNGTHRLGSSTAHTKSAIVDLTNAILRDDRVFHIANSDFFTRYNMQVTMEITMFKPWVSAGPTVVIREALERQRSAGWASARPAVSVTVRLWIMRGYMDSCVRGRHDVCVELTKRALEVLRGLREHWMLEPKENRGTVFEKSFMFGVQRLYVDALRQLNGKERSPEQLEELLQESDLLLQEMDQEPHLQEPSDPGFINSFFVYPRATAYACVSASSSRHPVLKVACSNKGYYYAEKAALASGQDEKELLRKSAIEYLNAAAELPVDDEKHPWFLNVALQKMLPSYSYKLREILEVMERIRTVTPLAQAIWESSQLGSAGIWETIEGVAEQEEEWRAMLEDGHITLNSVVAQREVLQGGQRLNAQVWMN
ncbi:hypothetical protein FB45DRAFT_731788 [Roridomyces roridus]|uniref:TPR-like protein n=1 Tax=Roridomyces roridus TaxID=1738132 RepID=A0AAD7CIA6_9AGAR|nr:hypothetical protein FB45DRAFT_731788 [Roridomyces roridus]